MDPYLCLSLIRWNAGNSLQERSMMLLSDQQEQQKKYNTSEWTGIAKRKCSLWKLKRRDWKVVIMNIFLPMKLLGRRKQIFYLIGTESALTTVDTVSVLRCHHIPEVQLSLLWTRFLSFILYAYYYYLPHVCSRAAILLSLTATVNDVFNINNK